MSLINRMLQDLDRRQALDTADAGVVRASTAKPASREWFWRVLVVLLTVALAWMGWVAIQLLPRKPLATDLAFLAANEARERPTVKPVAPPAPPAPPVIEAAAPVPVPAPEQPAPTVHVMPSTDALRLATELQTPIIEKPVAPAKPAAAAPVKPKAAAPAPKTAAPAPKAAVSANVDKRDRARSANDNAETLFRRAALLLNHGRVSEAEEQLLAALQADPRHAAARQAYISLLLEQRRNAAARRVLQDALVLEPAQPTFALALARIHAAERDYTAALAVLDRAAPIGEGSADFQAFRGAMLQRLGRHDEALVAYQNAVREGTPPATAWIGYAISLEAVGKHSEAAQAYRRALTVGPIAAEAREYAESRARALE